MRGSGAGVPRMCYSCCQSIYTGRRVAQGVVSYTVPPHDTPKGMCPGGEFTRAKWDQSHEIWIMLHNGPTWVVGGDTAIHELKRESGPFWVFTARWP
ncbi:MAG: hypothetical protein UX39_C0010G0015 [Candidatus Magasanikbacteria bacterium GW2011_GWA2_46_17]|uniref:Uncharacterized protein n=1 Tax=Candidatus Magasanikbacteria bacterium GW2011_GWA2_46_17 TaxID=1619042 RepID=A0A0G1R8C5_9BACT|nr:MAG: hypothetical protein UX39_C0010G0015 [Candidatus Magasanikbacteria bacterium GW2011_GWA2_46_17]